MEDWSGSEESGSYDLYLVDADGGVPQRLTNEPSAEIAGSFSRDGRSVLFSDRTGRSQIYRMPVGGGPSVQVTRGGGDYVQESYDARFVYYSKHSPRSGVWRVPVGGGEESPVVEPPDFLSGWDLSPAGIYYAATRWPAATGEEYTIRFFDFESGRTEALFTRRGPFEHWSLAVSPDEKWILYGEEPVAQSELMVSENFR